MPWQPGNSQDLFYLFWCLSLCCPDEGWVLFNLSVPSGFLWRFPAFYHKGGQKCLRKWQFLRQPHLTISSINQEETKEENGKQMLGAGQGYEWLMLRAGQGYEWSKRQGRIYSRRDLSLGLRQLPMQEFITAKWWQGARNGFLGECPVQ